jgi:hypothetical protein
MWRQSATFSQAPFSSYVTIQTPIQQFHHSRAKQGYAKLKTLQETQVGKNFCFHFSISDQDKLAPAPRRVPMYIPSMMVMATSMSVNLMKSQTHWVVERGAL